MASLALGVAGAFIGSAFGPVGASVGWSIGAMLGSALDPQKVEGPRLTDLKLQNSQYGGMIPIPYGTIRIAGNVIWQTDLQEISKTEGGKGGPEVTTYSYTASFAIRVCEGPVYGIRKMWADSRLVYDASTGASIRSLPCVIYTGTETQDPDPTMETELGVGAVPAHRGVCYVVFTDLDLTEFANRIPSFTFEVMERGYTNDLIRVHQFADDQTIEWGNGWSGGGTNGITTIPAIIDWPLDGRPIKVIERGGATVFEYTESTLVYDQSVSRSVDDQYPTAVAVDCGSNGTFTYYPIGRYSTNGLEIDVWNYLAGTVSATGITPSIAAVSVFCGGSGYPETSNNLAYDAGIPDDEYIGGASLSRDRKSLFLFTAPSSISGGDPVIDKWYKLVDSVVVDSGTVTPNMSYNAIGFGATVADGYVVNSFEDNGRWMWFGDGAGSCTISVYHIDDAGNFAFYTAGSSCQGVVDGTQFSDFSVYPYFTICALQEGYVGLVANNFVAVLTRYPANDSLAAPLDEVVSALSVRAGLTVGQIDVTRLANDRVDGYVLSSQGTVRSALEPLQAAYAFNAVESDGKVKFVKLGSAVCATIADDDLAATSGNDAPALTVIARTQEADLPRAVSVNYLDLDTDYQQGTQLAQRQLTYSEKVVTVAAPIAMRARTARQIADRALYNSWLERERFAFTTAREFEYLEPTDVVSVRGRTLRIVSKTRQSDRILRFDALPTHSSIYSQPGQGATGGSGFVPPVITPDQRTDMTMLDLPILVDGDAAYGFYIALTGNLSPTWNGATLFKSYDGGTNYTSLQDCTTLGAVGTASTTLGDFLGGNAFDEGNTLTVQLTAGSGTLSSTTAVLVLNGANRALIGSEIIQFKTATANGLRTYVLSGLLRGRNGTEFAIATHGASESFVMLVSTINVAGLYDEIGVERYYKAVTRGKTLDWGTATAFTNTGVALRPYAPCQLGGGRDGSDDITLTWVRRTRIGGSWLDYSDVPLSESAEQYLVYIYEDSSYASVKHSIVASAQTATYTAAQQTADFGSAQSTIYWAVGQVGTFAVGPLARGVT